MATRIIVAGRTRWASRDWPRTPDLFRENPDRPPAEPAPIDRVEPIDEHTGARVDPPPRRRPDGPGTAWTDHDGATYRILARVPADGGWVLAGTVMAWYGVDHAAVIAWLRRGLLDGVIEHGSPTKRYKIVDVAGCKAEAAALKRAPPKTPGRRARSKL